MVWARYREFPGVSVTDHGSGLIQRDANVDDLSAFLHQRLLREEEAASESLTKEVAQQFPPTRRFDQFKRTATATPVRGSRWRSWERGGNRRTMRQRKVLGDFQTRSGITPNAMSLTFRTHAPSGTHGRADSQLRTAHRSSDPKWCPGVVCESYESNQASVASAADRLESYRARIYQQGSLEKDRHHRRRPSGSRTELILELPSGRPSRSWSG